MPDDFERGGLPGDVELASWFDEPAGVRFAVPPFGSEKVLSALAGHVVSGPGYQRTS